MLLACSFHAHSLGGVRSAGARFSFSLPHWRSPRAATGSTTWPCWRSCSNGRTPGRGSALTTAARVLPIVLLGPLGGVMADRHDRRRLMIGADLVRVALMVALAAVAAAGLPIVLAPVIAAAATAAGTAVPPCVAVSTARLVPGPELQRANARRAAVGQAAIVAGPALGALVLVVSTPATAMLLNAVTFIASAVAVWLIGNGSGVRPVRHRGRDRFWRARWHRGRGPGVAGSAGRHPAARRRLGLQHRLPER